MLLAEEIRGLVKTVLLSFERVLESVPEVYDYSGVIVSLTLNCIINP